MVKALARDFRWRKLLDTGVYGSIEEVAAKEKINSSYVGRLLRMTLLAPDIVEAILDGRQPADITLALLMEPFPIEWEKQDWPLFQFQRGCQMTAMSKSKPQASPGKARTNNSALARRR